MVGWPTVPDILQKVKKSALKNLSSLNLESGTTFFAKKGKKHEKIELRQSPTPIVIFMHFWNKLCKQNYFDMSTVQKFLIFNEKINI